jgi:hypothetical protein
LADAGDGEAAAEAAADLGGGGAAVAAAVQALSALLKDARRGKAALSVWRRRSVISEAAAAAAAPAAVPAAVGPAVVAAPALLRLTLTSLRLEVVAQTYDTRAKAYVGGLALVDQDGHHMLHLAPNPQRRRRLERRRLERQRGRAVGGRDGRRGLRQRGRAARESSSSSTTRCT